MKSEGQNVVVSAWIRCAKHACAAAVMIGAFGGCGGGETSSSDGSVPGADTGSATACTEITTSAGDPPTFSWSGPAAAALGVAEFREGGTLMWLVQALPPTGPGFSSPVRYGMAPSGATEIQPAMPLVPGTRYSVTITLSPSAGGGSQCGTFTYAP